MNRIGQTTPETGVFTPEEFVEEVAAALPSSSDQEGFRLLEHARAWADLTYPDALPTTLETRIKKLEEQWHSKK